MLIQIVSNIRFAGIVLTNNEINLFSGSIFTVCSPILL